MDIKVRRISLLLISSLAVATVPCSSRTPQARPSVERQPPSLLSRQLAQISIQGATFLDALFQIGRSSDQCLGIVLLQRSSAVVEVPDINAESITVGDLLTKVLESAKGFDVRQETECIIVAPVANAPRYLKTVIPSFRTIRSPIELQSHYLSQALSATEPQPVHRGAWGTIASISASTDSPNVGPMNLKMLSVESILCKLATTAGSMMWIASPKKAAETTAPWQFIRYTESNVAANTELRIISDSLPD